MTFEQLVIKTDGYMWGRSCSCPQAKLHIQDSPIEQRIKEFDEKYGAEQDIHFNKNGNIKQGE